MIVADSKTPQEVADSLTHGFQSGAIFNTALSCPLSRMLRVG